MTTNTNDIPRATLIIAAARALNLTDDALHTIVDEALDNDASDYTNDADRAIFTLANALFSSDDDYDDFRLELRSDLDMLDDDERELIIAINHPFVAADPI